jgi:Na+/proline symporter
LLQSLAITALLLSAVGYLWLGARAFVQTRGLRDLLPLDVFGQAKVENADEFSAATVAATLSLATVVLAFTELAPIFGLWLLWTAATTSMGLLAVRLAAPLIWRRLDAFGSQRPTLHSFLGASFDSTLLTRSAAFCTAAGFLGALAVELTVGSRFLAGLVPSVNSTAAVLFLASVGVLYTLAGGFRVVIQTDRIQMIVIWLAIAALAALVVAQVEASGGLSAVLDRAPKGLFDLTWRAELTPFLIGIFVINVPTFLGDMSVWQRIAGTRAQAELETGLARSVIGAALSWSSLAILACFVVALAGPGLEGNPLAAFLVTMVSRMHLLVLAAAFVAIAGLYAASLSSASTQLIAAAQTLQIDVVRGGYVGEEFARSRRALAKGRILVLALGSGSVLVVEALEAAGFSISDLVFAIYGSQLGLAPAVLLALIGQPKFNMERGSWVAAAILLGFASGWSTALYGKLTRDADLVFLAPVASLLISGGVCLFAVLKKK